MLHVPYSATARSRRTCASTWSSSSRRRHPRRSSACRACKFDIDRCASTCASRSRPRRTWRGCCSRRRTGRRRSTPTSAASTTSARSSRRLPRHARTRVEYYAMLRSEVEERIREGKGPITPDGDMGEEKYRLVVEGPPNWTTSATSGRCSTTKAPSSWPRPTPRSAAPTTSASATTRTTRSSRSPSTAWAATPTCNLPHRASTCSADYINEYQADGC
jgi:hypothetical protein